MTDEITYCTANCANHDCAHQLDKAPTGRIVRWGYQPAGCPGMVTVDEPVALDAGQFDAGPLGGGDIYAPDEGANHAQE